MPVARNVSLSPSDQELKLAARELVRAYGGTDAAGMKLGQTQQRMSDIGLPNTDVFLAINHVAALEDVTVGKDGWPHVTRALARRAGGIFIALPTLPVGADDARAAVSEIMRETADVLTAFGEIFADGKVTAVESAMTTAQIDEAIVALTKARQLVQDSVPL